MRRQYASLLRYLASLLGSVAVIAGSLVLLFETPTSATAARPEAATVGALKRAVEPKALPALTAKDFDIARSVRVDVQGKAEPATVPAPAGAAASAQVANAAGPQGTIAASVEGEAAGVVAGPSAVVTADAANLRAFANKASTRVGVVRQGTRVTVLETERGWTRVRAEDGQTGWLATRFLG